MAKHMFLLMICMVLLTGCWDRVELEERGFVVGAAIDMPKDNKARIMLTQQLVVPAALSSGGGKSNGGGQGKPYFNVTAEGNSIFGIIRGTAAETSRSPYYAHNLLLIVSEEMASSPLFSKVLDHFIRYQEMRRSMKVLIAKGQAKDMLEIDPKNERIPATYIDSIAKNNFKNSRMLPVSRLGDIQQSLIEQQSFTIQEIKKAGDNAIKIEGNAVFQGKTNHLIGYLNGEETEGLNFLTGDIRGGIVEAEEKGETIVYKLKAATHHFDATLKSKDDMKFTVKIKTEGTIAESFNPYVNYQAYGMGVVENKVQAEIKKMTAKTINKLQQDLKVDVIGLGQYLKNYHPQFWQKVKGDWDTGKNYFSKAQIGVQVESNVEQHGTTIQTSERK